MIEQLPLRLQARDNEPGHGVLIRLGARNGYRSASRFAASLGMELRRVLTGQHSARVAVMAGLNPQPVQFSSPCVLMPERRVKLSGEEFELSDWSTRTRRSCIECHAEDADEARRLGISPATYVSHRSIWDLRLVKSCPVHRIKLTDRCHRCRRTFAWQTTNMLQCHRCQANLLEGVREPLTDEVGMYVVRRLKNGNTGGNTVLDHMPISAAMRLCERLGLIKSLGSVHTMPRQTTEALGMARALGFEMSQRLNSTVPEALNSLLLKGEEHKGLTRNYGWIYHEWLATADRFHAPIQHILFTHAVKHGLISSGEARLRNAPQPTITMTEAARRLGMSYARARKAADAARIIPLGSRRSVAFTLDPVAVARLKSPEKQMMSPKRAADELRTGKPQIQSLITTGILVSNCNQRIDHGAVAGLLAELAARCEDSPLPDDAIPLGQSGRNAAVPISRIIEAVRRGAIICWQGDGHGLARFRVRPSEVVKLRAPPSNLSIEAAARKIGVHRDCLRALIRCGAIGDLNGRITVSDA